MVEGQAQPDAISNSVSNTLGCNKRGATAHLRNNQSHQEAPTKQKDRRLINQVTQKPRCTVFSDTNDKIKKVQNLDPVHCAYVNHVTEAARILNFTSGLVFFRVKAGIVSGRWAALFVQQRTCPPALQSSSTNYINLQLQCFLGHVIDGAIK